MTFSDSIFIQRSLIGLACFIAGFWKSCFSIQAISRALPMTEKRSGLLVINLLSRSKMTSLRVYSRSEP